MIESKRYTIIVDDGAVYLDQCVYIHLNLSSCGIPDDVHALQFNNGSGWIEYRDTRDNLPLNSVDEFPAWAVSCIEKWELAYDLFPPRPNQ